MGYFLLRQTLCVFDHPELQQKLRERLCACHVVVLWAIDDVCSFIEDWQYGEGLLEQKVLPEWFDDDLDNPDTPATAWSFARQFQWEAQCDKTKEINDMVARGHTTYEEAERWP